MWVEFVVCSCPRLASHADVLGKEMCDEPLRTSGLEASPRSGEIYSWLFSLHLPLFYRNISKASHIINQFPGICNRPCKQQSYWVTLMLRTLIYLVPEFPFLFSSNRIEPQSSNNKLAHCRHFEAYFRLRRKNLWHQGNRSLPQGAYTLWRHYKE